MQYIKGKSFQCGQSAVTLGKFDGIHQGHQLLLEAILADPSLTSVLFTFDLNPANLFSEREIRQILTNEERAWLLQETPLDLLIDYPFTMETANTSADTFLKTVLIDQLHAKKIVIGEDFCFGKNREGNAAFLAEHAGTYGYELTVLPKKTYLGEVISSTRIKDELEKGNMKAVREMLGRPYFLYGEIVHGNHLGNTVGMPTINQIIPAEKAVPPYGVYAANIRLEGKTYQGITNIGVKPTIEGSRKAGAETWIFDFDGDVYGESAAVSLIHFIRPEQKFQSLAEVKAQVDLDVREARRAFQEYS